MEDWTGGRGTLDIAGEGFPKFQGLELPGYTGVGDRGLAQFSCVLESGCPAVSPPVSHLDDKLMGINGKLTFFSSEMKNRFNLLKGAICVCSGS